jgi:pumilio family protein 6
MIVITHTHASWIGDKSKAIDALVGLVNQAATEGEENVLGHNLASRVYKAIIVADKDGSIGFARKLLEAIRGELYHYATNYGGFVVLALLENPITQADTHKELKTVKKKLATAAKEHEQQKGLALLVEKLNCL